MASTSDEKPRSFLSTIQKTLTPKKSSKSQRSTKLPSLAQAVRTSYTSNAVPIPPSFLTTPAPDAQPMTVNRIAFATTPLPEYAGHYAAIIDHALAPSECAALLALAEAAAAPNDDDPNGRVWRPALVNVGRDLELAAPDYRRSDRIIWDAQPVVDRIVARAFAAPGVRADLARVAKSVEMLGARAARTQTWTFARANERMRFLRYKPGDFFARHCDGSYEDPGALPRCRSHYTLHLYLSGDGDRNSGGETTFWSGDGARRVDVAPVRGRILIFQHRGLLHSGEPVRGPGCKFTMRTDLMYTLDGEGESETS